MSLFEFCDMVDAYQETKTMERWEAAYWVANIISPHLKSPAKAETLMRPFLKPKTQEEIASESEKFFADFAAQRKEAGYG